MFWTTLRVVLGMLMGRRLDWWDTPAQEATLYETWLMAARGCSVENLVPTRSSLLGPRRIEGVRLPLRVTIAPYGSESSAGAVIRIRGFSGEVRLKHESLRTQTSKLAGAREIVVGDPEFDAEFFIEGDRVAVHAAFDAPTRLLALTLFGRRPPIGRGLFDDEGTGVGIASGVLTARFVDSGFPHPTLSPSDFLGRALALADRLAGGSEEERLAVIARSDPLIGVRLAALATLRDERPRASVTSPALAAACSDADPRVRLTAAVALGAGGRPTLRALATQTDVADDVAARAVTELRSHLPAEEARSILSEALRARRLATAEACLDSLSRSGPHAGVIARVLALEEKALGAAAARALGRCGSFEDVPLLREVEARHPRNDELPRACRSAIAAIHSRQSGASPGQLSLAHGRAGEVALAGDEAGRVSLDSRERDE